MPKYTKSEWRWRMAEVLAKRIKDDPSLAEIEEANKLVWRLCRLANDNALYAERDNDERWYYTPKLARKLERLEERWIEREREISALFGKYRCRIEWTCCYPTIYADEGGSIDYCEMY